MSSGTYASKSATKHRGCGTRLRSRNRHSTPRIRHSTLKHMQRKLALSLVFLLTFSAALKAGDWVVYEGKEGPGVGKHIVFLSGDEEYRSEEGLPMLGKIMAIRHGFKCTVLFSVNPKDGTIDPTTKDNIPGMEALASA